MNKIVACGIPRSGSTLVWQIAHRVINKKIIKIHAGCLMEKKRYEKFDFMIANVRDPYDIFGSVFRHLLLEDKSDGTRTNIQVTIEEWTKNVKFIHNHFQSFQEALSHFENKSIILRYEDYWNDFDKAIEILEEVQGKKISKDTKKIIYQECSYQSNLKRSFTENGEPELENYDDFRIWKKHVGVATPESWRLFLPQWALNEMKDVCLEMCKAWEYEYE